MSNCPNCGAVLQPGAIDPPGPHGRPELKCPQCGNIYRWIAEQLKLSSRKPLAQ